MKLRDYVKPELDIATYAEKFGIQRERAEALRAEVVVATLRASEALRDNQKNVPEKNLERFFGNPMAFATHSVADIECENFNEVIFVLISAEELMLLYHKDREGKFGSVADKVMDMMMGKMKEGRK